MVSQKVFQKVNGVPKGKWYSKRYPKMVTQKLEIISTLAYGFFDLVKVFQIRFKVFKFMNSLNTLVDMILS